MNRALRRSSSLVGATLLLLSGMGVASADNITTAIGASGTTTVTISGGVAQSDIDYWVFSNNNMDNCAAADGTPAVVTIHVDPASGLTVDADLVAAGNQASLSFASCGTATQGLRKAVHFKASEVGSWSVSATVADLNGKYNPKTASFTFTSVPGNTAPTVAVTGVADGATYELGAVPAAGCQVTDAEDGNSTTEASLSPISGPLAAYGIGDRTATCSHKDDGGLSATPVSATFHIVDTTKPALVGMPSDQVVEAASSSGATATWTDPTATDLGGIASGPTCSPASGSPFGFGASTVTCSATDQAGNTKSATFTVTVEDTTDPVISGGSGTTLEATGPLTSAAYVAPTATDTADDSVPVDCVPPSGSDFPVGTTTVTCSATDDSNNSSTSQLDVVIRDTTGPEISAANVTGVEATGPAGAPVTFAPNAVDLVDGDVAVDCTPASGSTFVLGTTTVDCSSTDSRGNTSYDSFTVEVVDTTAPELTVPDDITGVEATGPTGAVVTFAASATDVYDESPTVSCIPESGSTFALGTTLVTCTAEDNSGNDSEVSFAVEVVDTTAPTVNVPSLDPVEATGPDGAAVTFDVSASDIVDSSVPVRCDWETGDIFPLGSTPVSCTGTDDSGNVGKGTFSVLVQDTTAPDVEVPADVTVEATGPTGADVTYPATEISAHDVVDGDLEPSCVPPSGSHFTLDDTATVTCSATDNAENTGYGTFDVTVVDTTAPALTVPGDITVGATSASGAVVSYSATATDIVDGAVRPVCTPASDSTFAPGTTTVTCTATDAHGNSVTKTFTVTVSFGWNGFFQPVDNNGVFNVIKGGQSVPLKWNVPNGSGGWISSLAIVQSTRQVEVACGGSAVTDVVEATSTGGTSLRYDTTANQYIYNWQSPKTASKCYRVTVTLTDGSKHEALFKTK